MHFSLATILAIAPLFAFASPVVEQPHITNFNRRDGVDQIPPSHQYIRSTAADSRSPCPAVNALANHGYLPRDGRNVTSIQMISALTDVYKISHPLATVLALGGIALDGHGLVLDLEGLSAHNKIEHDASIFHRDLDETGGKVPTSKPDPVLVQEILDSSDGQKVTLEDLIHAKARRETRAKVDGIDGNYPKDYMKIFSHGELILATEVLQRDGPGIPIEWFKSWVLEERLPEGLNPPHITGLLDVHSKTEKVTKEIAALHAAANKRRDA